MNKFTSQQFDQSLKQEPLFWEKLVFRKPSRLLLPYVARTNLTPSQISVISFLIGICGIGLVALGNYWLQIGGGLLLLISNLVDCFDGEIARLKKLATRYGGFIDALFDDLKESLVFFALASNHFVKTADRSIAFPLILVILVMFLSYGNAYRLKDVYNLKQKKIRRQFLNKNRGAIKLSAKILSEFYPSSAIWVIIFLGLLVNQISFLFYIFIFTRTALFIFLIYFAYTKKGKTSPVAPT